MIRLILTGGLGNQMFQYAAAKSLALSLNTSLIIDLYALNKKTQGTKRNYELDIFNIDTEISSSYKTKFFVKASPLVQRNKSFFLQLGYVRDYSAIVYLPEFSQLNNRNLILHGYFQNPKYFGKHEDIIRQEFSFQKELSDKNADIAQRIKSSNSIAVHIRRGDYLTDENFAVCTKEYYQKAIEFISGQIDSPQYYIFSEDFDWVSKNIKFESNSVEFIDWNKGKDSYIDMQLMSLCKHNIIANSSFSWWAAWLNGNKNKIVCAPSNWFRNEIRNKDLMDFYPPNWEMI